MVKLSPEVLEAKRKQAEMVWALHDSVSGGRSHNSKSLTASVIPLQDTSDTSLHTVILQGMRRRKPSITLPEIWDAVEDLDLPTEVEQMYFAFQWLNMKGKPSWIENNMYILDFWVFTVKNALRAYQEFDSLGNTGLSNCWAIRSAARYDSVDSESYPRLRSFKEKGDYNPQDMIKGRSPEPTLVDKVELTCPELQVRGVWTKLLYDAQAARPQGRTSHAAFIWRRRLYIGGGLDDPSYMDLETRKWKRLPDIPSNSRDSCLSGIRPMRVWQDKVHLFSGRLQVQVFDLVTEKWSILNTSLPRNKSWPYPSSGLEAFNTALLDDTLYVFGGQDSNDALGNNLFMALHLPTAKWDHISGTPTMIPKKDQPECRTLPAMWAVPEQRKIYVMYGSALRTHARFGNRPHGAEIDHTWDDQWSFHVDERKWKRERMRGNYPSPRTEHASVFSTAMNRTIIYGGYHSNHGFKENDPDMFQGVFGYAYFGDAFLWNPDTGIWQHILVKGFPSYRSMSSLTCDPETGKLYMFGGFCNGDFIPTKNMMGRFYSDVWQLKIDTPGGHWDPKDLERDIRAEKMGPWLRCFTCGNCGITFQKCAGTCGGKYYFCSKDCQRAGWKEHKSKHGCRKI
ncbi:hypothetical protein VKT23_014469 [Stygiomarasmius scandens]|uniref:MYND-type domain-containing protein n=1 Tax=Marasmiellus scandens TaxID=2682957 RepID=A0ABR1J4S1_9AGAR